MGMSPLEFQERSRLFQVVIICPAESELPTHRRGLLLLDFVWTEVGHFKSAPNHALV